MSQRVYVVGLGVISAIGNSIAETIEAFHQHRDGIKGINNLDTFHKGFPVGEVMLNDRDLMSHLLVSREIPRTALLGMHAAQQAVQDANITVSDWRTGLISGTTVGGMDLTEAFFRKYLQHAASGKLREIIHHECGSITELIADYLGINNFISTINTACSSSVNSIIVGSRLIKHGQLDIVVAGGADALTRFTLNGFNSLMILDKEPSRPFDESRAGLNLGEGAGFMVLVSEKVLKSCGLTPYGRVAGYANTSDAFHQTASSPEGTGPYLAMKKALAMSELDIDEIDYINLHGTGTENNDLSEGNALKKLFGSDLPPFSSTKAFTGHTLGASGGIESVFSMLAIAHGCVFPNLRFETPMVGLGIQPQSIFKDQINVNHVLNNSFGFGGNCSSIVFSAD